MPLEQNLILAQYFHSLFGHANFEGLKTVLRTCSEERDEDGISQFCRVIEAGANLHLNKAALRAYDARIGELENELRQHREEFKSLRYFQYLALLSEYGRCILFDYSYRHFFGDGYGKNFHVLNASNATEDRSDDMMLGGLLVFYQQVRCYSAEREALRPYNIESPLWILL